MVEIIPGQIDTLNNCVTGSRPFSSRNSVNMPPQAEKTPAEVVHQDTAEPCQGEPEPVKAKQLTTCDTPTPCKFPSFVKTIQRFNMRTLSRDFRLEIPATFVKEHGHSFQATVVLQGPSGRLTPVCLRIQSYAIQDRVHFAGAGWRAFVLENGFQVGHQLLFSLISKSTFAVRHVNSTASSLHVKKQTKLSVEPNHRIIRTSVINSSCHGLKFPPNVPEMSARPSGESFAMMKDDVVYANGTSRVKQEVESLVGDLQCPHFVTKICKSNIRESHSSSLIEAFWLNKVVLELAKQSVPYKFLEKYGAYFSKKLNIFQGPSGRMVELYFSGTQMPRFTTGWKAFHKENGIQLGDVLLFSLRAPACWLVQVVRSDSGELRIGATPK